PGPRVSHQNIAVDRHGALTEPVEIGDAPERSADQTLDLLRATPRPAPIHLATGPFQGGSREHRVLARDPTTTRAAEPARHVLRRGGRTQHAGLPHGEQDGPVRPVLVPQLVDDRTEFAGCATVGPCHRPTSHTASRVATSIGPSNNPAPCSSDTPGSRTGVRCVSTSRLTSARAASSAACSALRWKKV